MVRANPRLRHLSVATAVLLLAAGSARAEPQPPPPPEPSGPVAVPYPNPEPLPPCPNRFCIPKPLALAQDQATPQPPAPVVHKHLGGIKYEDMTTGDAMPTGGATEQVIKVESISWGELGTGPVHSADPMEGGQVTARTYHPGKPTYGDATLEGTATVHSADPMEGGQVTALHYRPGRQKPGSMTEVPMTPDQPPQVTGTTGTTAKVKATFKTLAGACTNGAHIDKVLITAREGSYTLHDVTVTDVTPAKDGMETVSVSYASRDQ